MILQRFLLRQREQGRLLALCSKNDKQDVIDVLDHHPDILLRSQKFAALKVNWNRKSDNIAEIARELSLALDTFVFIDDNPAECAEVHARFPQIHTITLPTDLSTMSVFLNSIWELDKIIIT